MESRHGTLSSSVVATVTLTEDARTVTVVNRSGSAEIFFTVTGVAPTVNGDDCEILPATISSVTVSATAHGAPVVKLISSGTPSYSVIAR